MVTYNPFENLLSGISYGGQPAAGVGGVDMNQMATNYEPGKIGIQLGRNIYEQMNLPQAFTSQVEGLRSGQAAALKGLQERSAETGISPTAMSAIGAQGAQQAGEQAAAAQRNTQQMGFNVAQQIGSQMVLPGLMQEAGQKRREELMRLEMERQRRLAKKRRRFGLASLGAMLFGPAILGKLGSSLGFKAATPAISGMLPGGVPLSIPATAGSSGFMGLGGLVNKAGSMLGAMSPMGGGGVMGGMMSAGLMGDLSGQLSKAIKAGQHSDAETIMNMMTASMQQQALQQQMMQSLWGLGQPTGVTNDPMLMALAQGMR